MGHKERRVGFIEAKGRRMELLAVGILWIKAQKWDRQDMCLLDWSRNLKLGTGVTTVDKVDRQSVGSSQREGFYCCNADSEPLNVRT